MSEANQITGILQSIARGEASSSEQLFPLVYAELHKLAVARLKHETPGHTLQPTALVHEVFLRLVAPRDQKNWDNVGHFFGAAANAMRRILIENARKKQSLKRGGNHARVEMPIDDAMVDFDDERLIRLDEALIKLAEEDPIKAKLVELRFFGGLGMDEASDVLKISRATAHRYWKYARAWLFLEIS